MNGGSSPLPPPPLKQAPKFERLRRAFGPGQGSDLAQASSVGIAFAVAIVLGLAAGWWLDKKFDSAPICLLSGLFIGIAAGFKNLFTVAGRLEKRETARRREADAKLAEAKAKAMNTNSDNRRPLS